MLRLVGAITSVLFDLLRFGALFFWASFMIRAENLVLRRQLAGYLERGIRPRRVDFATRVSCRSSLGSLSGAMRWSMSGLQP